MRRFLLVVSLLFFLVPLGGQAAFRWPWQTVKPPASPVAPPVINAEALKSAQEKVQRWERLVGSKTARVGEKFTAEFSQAEFEALARDTVRQSKASSLDPASLAIKVSDGKFTVSGTIIKPITFGIQVTLTAAVANGSLVTQVKSARVGILPVAGHIVERFADDAFGRSWRQALNPKGFFWDEVKLSGGKAYLAGHRVKAKK